MQKRASFRAPTSPAHRIDDDRSVSVIHHADLHVLLRRCAIPGGDLPDTGSNLDANSLGPPRKMQGNQYGAKGSNANKPRADSIPDVDLLIKCHAETRGLTPGISCGAKRRQPACCC